MSIRWLQNPCWDGNQKKVKASLDVCTEDEGNITQDENESLPSYDKQVKVCSYNALAQSMIRRDWFPYASTQSLKWAYRRELFRKQMDLSPLDIISMQEVDTAQLNSFWVPFLESQGFVVRFVGKREKVSHGLLIAFRATKFEEKCHFALQCEDMRLDAREEFEYSETDKPNSVQLLALELKKDQTRVGSDDGQDSYDGIVISNTHLCWRYQLGYTKLRQVHYLLKSVDTLIEKLKPQKYAPILTGDWNCTTNTLPHCIIRSKALPPPFPMQDSYCHYPTLCNTLVNGETSDSMLLDETKPFGSRVGDESLLNILESNRAPYPPVRFDMLTSAGLMRANDLIMRKGVSSFIPNFHKDAYKHLGENVKVDSDFTDHLYSFNECEEENKSLTKVLASDFFFACCFPGFTRLSEIANEYLCLLPRFWQVIFEDVTLLSDFCDQFLGEEENTESKIAFWLLDKETALNLEEKSKLKTLRDDIKKWMKDVRNAEITLRQECDGIKLAMESSKQMLERVQVRVMKAMEKEECSKSLAEPASDQKHNANLAELVGQMTAADDEFLTRRKVALESLHGVRNRNEEQLKTSIPHLFLLDLPRPNPKLTAKILLQRTADVTMIMKEIQSFENIPQMTSAYHWYRPNYANEDSKNEVYDTCRESKPCPCYPICSKVSNVHLDGPSFTTFTPFFAGSLDTIYVPTTKCKIAAISELPKRTEVDRFGGLPNDVHPSDHLKIAVSLDFSRELNK